MISVQDGLIVETGARVSRAPEWLRWLLPAGWLMASVGYYGPWITHKTSALTLSGADMGEFVKFLPSVLDGSLTLTRQLLYMPPLAVAVCIGLLIGSTGLAYSALARGLALLLAFTVSLQLLPPAWSPTALPSPEFRVQTAFLIVSWLMLSGFWLWGRLPLWLSGSASMLMALAAGGLAAWQFLLARPAVAQVYGTAAPLGWGFALCMAGLAVIAAAAGSVARRSATGD